jgi:hypothetical protein
MARVGLLESLVSAGSYRGLNVEKCRQPDEMLRTGLERIAAGRNKS